MPSIRLTAAATSTMPRYLLVAITAIYGLIGLFGRDPWKTDDAVGFGMMWHLVNSPIEQWVLPHLEGRYEIVTGPLPYWLGAFFIELFGGILGAHPASGLYSAFCFFLSCAALWHACYLLGRRKEVQPVAFALGGQPEPKDYGRTLADSALMIFLACVGLTLKVHETTPALAQLLGICMVLYGTVRGLDMPSQGGFWAGLGIAVIGLSGPLWLLFFVLLGLLASILLCEVKSHARWLGITSLIAMCGLCIWPLSWLATGLSSEQMSLIMQAWWGSENFQPLPSQTSLGFVARNLVLFSWPVWPLAIWSLGYWRQGANYPLGGIRNPHMAFTLGLLVFLFLYQVFQVVPSDQSFTLIIPPMVVLACFSLPIIKRSVISFIDWFALLTFTILGIFIWLMWFAMMTQTPASLAKNIAKKVPGFIPEFSWIGFIVALTATILWLAIVRWRTSRAPKAIWRAVVISAAGTTLTWVLLMTLWLPTINYAKTYRQVAERLVKAIPSDYRCINTSHLGDGQLASFNYFTDLRLKDDANCDLWLGNRPGASKARAEQLGLKIELIWEDRRVSDRSERLRLYRVVGYDR